MKHKYYYTYRVDCTAVGWEGYYYLGQHTTSNLDDGYKGSGKKLKEYYKLYPNDYTFTIIEFYSNKTELDIAEQTLLSDLWKTDSYCLNCMSGGSGGWSIVNKRGVLSEEHKQKISKAQRGKKLTEDHKKKLSEARKGKKPWNTGKNIGPMSGKTSPNKGKKMSEEQKQKLSTLNKGRHRVYREDGTYYYTK